MAFFGIMIIVSVAIAVAVLHSVLLLSSSASAVQSQANEYSAMVSVEAFAEAINETFPSSGGAPALSNWRVALHTSAAADQLNVSISDNYILVRAVSNPDVYAAVLLPSKTS